MKQTVRIDFCDFWSGFCKTNNWFYNLLKDHFDLQICDKPDFLIYGDTGHLHRLHSCVKIYYDGEARRPNFDECDYGLTHHYIDDPRHLRVPVYALYGKAEDLSKEKLKVEELFASKKGFCC